jgi:hypothetical protein
MWYQSVQNVTQKKQVRMAEILRCVRELNCQLHETRTARLINFFLQLKSFLIYMAGLMVVTKQVVRHRSYKGEENGTEMHPPKLVVLSTE